jgi:murein L,D-transpeptidase YafK
VNREVGTRSKSRRIVIATVIFVSIGLVLAGFFAVTHGSKPALPNTTIIDRIVVEKGARKLSVYRHGCPVKAYRVALGGQPVGAKQEEGDMKTPEGSYVIDYRNPHSDYHLALHVSYPDREDERRAAARGVSAGGDIMIHGLPNGRGWMGELHRQKDWTAGCIAVTDQEIEELWRIIADGTPIEIRP